MPGNRKQMIIFVLVVSFVMLPPSTSVDQY